MARSPRTTTQISVSITAALAATWEAIRRAHPDVPDAVITLGSGSDGRKLVKLGHFAAASWERGGEYQHEVLVSSEGLSRTAREVLGTLLHEAAHALNAEAGIVDTSRQGRYHNLDYRWAAEAIGLQVAVPPVDAHGFGSTTVPAETAARYRPELKRLAACLQMARYLAPAGPARPRVNGWVRGSCSCPRIVRASLATWARGPIFCLGCGENFVQDELHEEDGD